MCILNIKNTIDKCVFLNGMNRCQMTVKRSAMSFGTSPISCDSKILSKISYLIKLFLNTTQNYILCSNYLYSYSISNQLDIAIQRQHRSMTTQEI